MLKSKTTRRTMLASSAAGITALVPYTFAADPNAVGKPASKNDRLRLGAIGMRYQGTVIAKKAADYGDIVAICDVDREIAQKAKVEFGGKAALYEDYRELLDRPDIDAVTIGTPDHWHAKMILDAVKAGKDVYCEKPLTLTIDEGRRLVREVPRSGRVVQIGTWQRSDWRFRLACEMVRAGRIGRVQKVVCTLGRNVTGGPFAAKPVPPHLNWDLWQGQTPDVPYVRERCHYTFRWWYEYSGGQMTDWGAHHYDIVQWALGEQFSGPVEIEGNATMPQIAGGYNVAVRYSARFKYASGVEVELLDDGRNGVMFEGDRGRIFVNRENLSGKPVEGLKQDPLPREQFKLYAHDNLARPPRAGKLDAIVNHMGNFFDCLRSRRTPIADVVSQHRSVSACHLANISMRLGRKLKWDPEKEVVNGDEEANAMLARAARPPWGV